MNANLVKKVGMVVVVERVVEIAVDKDYCKVMFKTPGPVKRKFYNWMRWALRFAR